MDSRCLRQWIIPDLISQKEQLPGGAVVSTLAVKGLWFESWPGPFCVQFACSLRAHGGFPGFIGCLCVLLCVVQQHTGGLSSVYPAVSPHLGINQLYEMDRILILACFLKPDWRVSKFAKLEQRSELLKTTSASTTPSPHNHTVAMAAMQKRLPDGFSVLS